MRTIRATLCGAAGLLIALAPCAAPAVATAPALFAAPRARDAHRTPIVATAHATSGAYSIRDFGSPPGTVGGVTAPVAFDDAGDVAGVAATATGTVCVVWSNGAFVPVFQPPEVRDCVPEAIVPDARRTGAYRVVGWVDTTFAGGLIDAGQSVLQLPFVGGGDATSAVVRYNVAHEPAVVGGVSPSGTAVAQGYDAQAIPGGPAVGAFSLAHDRLENWTSLPAASGCAGTPASPCFAYLALTGCAFGGCAIDKHGTVLGIDWPNLTPMVAHLGRMSDARELPLGHVTVDAFNDSNQLVYHVPSGAGYAAVLFDIKTHVSTPLGSFGTCDAFFPFSMNDAGAVLGTAEGCGSGRPVQYWIWTAGTGITALDVRIDPLQYHAVMPLGIDDAGRILADLQLRGGGHDWGTLQPAAGATRAPHVAVIAPPAAAASRSSASVASAAPPRARARHDASVATSLPARPLLHPASRVRTPSDASYAVVDVGAPSGETLAAPVAFNDTGQIVGFGKPVGTTGRQDCIAYTGSAFVVPQTDGLTSTCSPSSVTNLDPGTKHFRFVGSGSGTYVQGPYPIYGVGDATSATFQELSHHLPAFLSGIVSTGFAIGSAYDGNGPGLSGDVAFALSGRPHPMAFEPATAGCAYPAYCVGPPSGACPFGGCAVNDAGTIVGFDADATRSSTIEYRVLGSATGAVPLVNGAVSVTGLNRSNRFVYAAYAGAFGVAAYAYTIGASGQPVAIPAFAHSSCTTYVPLSQNDRGSVLGYTAACSNPSDATYWVWHGGRTLVDLADALQANGYAAIAPVGINDRGEILAALVTTASVTHWGVLQPARPGAAIRRR